MAAFQSARVTPRAAALRGIYAIVNEGARDPIELARAACGAGVRVLQYRAKGGIVTGRLRHLRELTREAGALLLLNDDAAAAYAFDCDGVHLGPDDAGFADVAGVRALLGDRLIGLSCGAVDEARVAAAGGADYVGIGSVYATPSKGDAGEPIGIAGLSEVAAATTLPAAAIGGISLINLRHVRATGVAMAAVISALAEAPDAAAAAAELVAAWNAAAS